MALVKKISVLRKVIDRSFSLIELIIVTTIIAILAIISIPYLLETQTRAKVSRAYADMRSIATGIEAYYVDNNAYPPNDGYYNVIPVQISTPVAYLTNSILVDPFSDNEWDTNYGELERYYSYHKIVNMERFLSDARMGYPAPVEAIDMMGFNKGAFTKYGKWRLVSNGPDRQYSDRDMFAFTDPVLLGSDIPYDPTNGTISWGNILWTQNKIQ